MECLYSLFFIVFDKMTLEQRLDTLAQLGEHLLGKDEYLEAVMARTKYHNPWFTIENQEKAVKAIATQFLQKEKLEKWVGGYEMKEPGTSKWVGLVMAGNIPLVGFHDVLSVFVSGHKSRIKLSEKDQYLLPYFIKLMTQFNGEAAGYFEVVNRMSDMDVVIATGSNNSSRYFEAYFGKYPHIIRRNRNAIAILDGTESKEEVQNLGRDIFRFFGLGCRNVSKIYLPKGYKIEGLMEQLHDYRDLIRHDKYKNNFDYNLALVMMNRTKYWNNGCVILTESESIASRIAMLHFEEYDDLGILSNELQKRRDEIQVIVSKSPVEGIPSVGFGEAQSPTLNDYPDGVDVMEFLLGVG